MAWSSIAAGETDADSPLNQTLMDKIRGNLNSLYARYPVIISEGVQRGSASTVTTPGVLISDTNDGSDIAIFKVFIPAEAKTLTFYFCGAYGAGSTNPAFKATVGGASSSYAVITTLYGAPTSLTWDSAVTLTVSGTGAQTLTIYTRSGGAGTCYFGGIFGYVSEWD